MDRKPDIHDWVSIGCVLVAVLLWAFAFVALRL